MTRPVALGVGPGLGIGIAVGRPIAGTRWRIARLAKQTRVEQFMAKNYVATEAYAYCLTVALLASPLVIRSDMLAPAVLILAASLTVYLGSCAPPLGPKPLLTLPLALIAPFLAAVPLLGLYTSQRIGFDVAVPYKDFVCMFGLLGLENVFTNGLAALRSLPLRASGDTRAVSVVAALAIVLIYLFSSGPTELAASNLIAWSLALLSIRATSVDSFVVAAVLLLGLVCYDVFFVFSTDMMASVVRQVEVPFSLRMSKSFNSDNPAVILGLGDIVIPGVAVAFLRQFGEAAEGPYFINAVIAYVVGLTIALLANTFIQNGQPALLYIVPAILASALLTAFWYGEVHELLSFQHDDEHADAGEDIPELKPGQLLVARDANDDGMFGTSVVLLLEHDHSKASLGVVINRRLCRSDRELLLCRMRESSAGWLPEIISQRRTERSAFQLLKGDVRLGGPAGTSDFPYQGSIVLHNDRSLQKARVAIPARVGEKNLFWSYLSDWDPVQDQQDAILFVGLSAWGKGQLAREVRRGTWSWTQASPCDASQLSDFRERLISSGNLQCFEPSSSDGGDVLKQINFQQ